MCEPDGGRHGGAAVEPPGHHHGKIPDAHLAGGGRAAKTLQLIARKAHPRHTVDDADGGRVRTGRTDGRLHPQRHLHVERLGKPVGDKGGLKRHHGLATRQGDGDLGGDVEHRPLRAGVADDVLPQIQIAVCHGAAGAGHVIFKAQGLRSGLYAYRLRVLEDGGGPATTMAGRMLLTH